MIFQSYYIVGVPKLFISFLILIFISTLVLRRITQSFSEQMPKKSVNLPLENILLAKDLQHGQNVFFIDTVRMKKRDKDRPFTARQACAIESAGKNICFTNLT